MNVFTLPQSDINLTINRMPIPIGLKAEDYIQQVLHQFRHNLKGYQELSFQYNLPDNLLSCTLTYCWQSPEGKIYQITRLQMAKNILLSFTYTSIAPFVESQQDYLLTILSSFNPREND